jgi:(p)ppGpp synthase/HD superfamily hydrolase
LCGMATMGDQFGERFQAALRQAAGWHRGQRRKGSAVPYAGHLLGVAAIVIDAGGTEDQAIAALLHDTLEDQPERVTEVDLESQFGPDVLRMVRQCSDLDPAGRGAGTWLRRKQAYLAELPHKPVDSLLVTLADKLYNARSMRLDRAEEPRGFWERFNAPEDDQRWYYENLVAAFRGSPIDQRHRRLVDELEQEVRALFASQG